MAVSRSRPLSPHLSVYKMTITMAMSIIHRITGAALYVGTVLLAIWLLAAALSPEAFATCRLFGARSSDGSFSSAILGLVHHALGGFAISFGIRVRALAPKD